MNNLFPTMVYLLCFATSTACAILLGRSFKRTRGRLLFWSSLCFILLAANNFVLVVDLVFLPYVDFRLIRLLLSLCSVAVLLFGFIWNSAEDR